MTEKPKEIVCVTGASGYIGSHVIRCLLEKGYTVRGTVRDPNDKEKTAHLLEIANGQPGTLELVAADLMQPDTLEPAFAGCTWICHIASAVRLRADDPQRDIVDVAVEGTRQAMRAAAATPSVKRMIVTSSVAAVYDDNPRPRHIYTEADWNESATLKSSPYALSKTLAEKEAWSLWEALPKEDRFSLVTLCPALVLGPVYTRVHLRTSPTVLHDLVSGKFPATPNFCWGIVDVRDVAEAHVIALENPKTSGRYLCSHQALWMYQMVDILRPLFPQYRLPKYRLPNWLMYIFAFFDKRLSFSFLRRNLGHMNQFDNRKIREEMALRFRPVEETLRDTCQSFIERGFLQPPTAKK